MFQTIFDESLMASGTRQNTQHLRDTMSSFSNDFDETDAMFLKFVEDLNNPMGRSSSVDDNSGTPQPSPTLTPWKTCPFSTPRVGALRSRQWKDFDVDHPWHGEAYFATCCSLQSGDRHYFFVLNFNDQAMNSFIEHQMLSTFKEFRGDCHRHLDYAEACANRPSHILNQMLEFQSQPTLEDSQPLSRDEICEMC
ncbi:gamma-aminobutyrate transaminase POP2 [Cucumis melo var. makuwa]|uniref:Gamma-aminobutyrate transaminase POP2 n=1 Tax=Cucumis melo var. makuwa TaxID=1194695 RepID=A0A5A7TM04_CUCMM|nr:gamma-aminobutyrate transaminase POP2 [Cucumis melo var. makuwa]